MENYMINVLKQKKIKKKLMKKQKNLILKAISQIFLK